MAGGSAATISALREDPHPLIIIVPTRNPAHKSKRGRQSMRERRDCMSNPSKGLPPLLPWMGSNVKPAKTRETASLACHSRAFDVPDLRRHDLRLQKDIGI